MRLGPDVIFCFRQTSGKAFPLSGKQDNTPNVYYITPHPIKDRPQSPLRAVLYLFMHAAASISGALSGGMDAYRLGGDEFVVVIPGAGADGAVAFIEKWKRKLDELNSLDPDFACVIACGYAVGAGADLSAVVHLADRNMAIGVLLHIFWPSISASPGQVSTHWPQPTQFSLSILAT